MSSIKYASLFALTAQNSFLSILLQGSATIGYSPATVVLVTEITKGFTAFLIALGVAWYSEELEGSPAQARLSKSLFTVKDNVFTSDCWKLGVPAALYVVGNNLQFVGAANLDLPTFQVTYNLKILTTALLSVLVLQKQLKAKQWLALCLLVAGVAAVQISASSGKQGKEAIQRQPLVGLVAILIACCTSGFAGVYFEKVLKGTKTDLWSRNVQMSFFSLLPALCTSVLSSKPMFLNFGWMAMAIVATQALGGLITAVVIKYADNILKGFAAALAVLIAALAGVLFFNFTFSLSFAAGSTLVIAATFVYAAEDRPPPSIPASVSLADAYDGDDTALLKIDEDTEMDILPHSDNRTK